jgi:transcriptional regulator with XRE-family HTH domain
MTLRDLRERKNLTLRSASKELGIHFTHLSKIENGHENPGRKLVGRMAKLYGRSERHICGLGRNGK